MRLAFIFVGLNGRNLDASLVTNIFDLVCKPGFFFQVQIAEDPCNCFKYIGFAHTVATDYDLSNAGLVKINFKINKVSEISEVKTVNSHGLRVLSSKTTFDPSGQTRALAPIGFFSRTSFRKDANSR